MKSPLKSTGFKVFAGIIFLSGAAMVLTFWRNVGINLGYAPTQPIPFSHKRHAGDNNIPCMYCHSNADKSRHATVPSMNVCMNCHQVVKTDSPLIKQVTQHYKENKPIEWVKVHDVPDFVFFDHKRHVKKGIACQTCHGPVETMAVIEQVETLNMGFCVNCHRANGAPQDCYTCHH